MAESVIRALRKRKLVKITLITVGKVKEKYLRDAIAEYSKRLGRYCKLGIVEVADEKTPEHASDGLERQIKAKEGERIAKHIRCVTTGDTISITYNHSFTNFYVFIFSEALLFL